MRKIALVNQKGGVGKTTSAINIGAGLARLNKKVLLIDLDPQAHLTYSLGIQAHDLARTVYDLLKGDVSPQGIIIERDGISVIPSSIDLAGAEIELSGIVGRELILKEALGELKGYDYVIIDCPPSLGVLTINALIASKDVFIPLQTEFLALQGIRKLLQTVETVGKRLNRGLDVRGVIATRYDGRKNLSREVVEQIKGYFGSKMFKTLIRDNVALAEAPSYGKTIFEYRSKCYGATDYLNLCKEIIKRGM